MKAELIDYMGNDLRVVNAARVSFSKESELEYPPVCRYDCNCGEPHWEDYSDQPRLNKSDEKLITYLANHNHWTPFSHVIISIRETVPIFVARQRFKHTVGFSYNEVSRRYVDDKPEFFYPEFWRGKPKNAKQGSSEEVIHWSGKNINYNDLMDLCLSEYQHAIESGVAPEQARMVLPQSMYTSYYVTGSLAAWARAYNLRSDSHAQLEIQELAQQWNDIIQPLCPASWTALTGTKQ